MLQRWQRVVGLCSVLYLTFCMEIWLFQNRGAQCCKQMRSLLGCDPDDVMTPCRGFTGARARPHMMARAAAAHGPPPLV